MLFNIYVGSVILTFVLIVLGFVCVKQNLDKYKKEYNVELINNANATLAQKIVFFIIACVIACIPVIGLLFFILFLTLPAAFGYDSENALAETFWKSLLNSYEEKYLGEE